MHAIRKQCKAIYRKQKQNLHGNNENAQETQLWKPPGDPDSDLQSEQLLLPICCKGKGPVKENGLKSQRVLAKGFLPMIFPLISTGNMITGPPLKGLLAKVFKSISCLLLALILPLAAVYL